MGKTAFLKIRKNIYDLKIKIAYHASKKTVDGN